MQGDERYRFIGDKIAEGGQGAVYLAEDVMHERRVAVKVLNCESSEIAFLRQLLVEEAKLQFKLSNQENPHPNIVHVIDVRTIDGDPAIVMEYVEGKCLHDLMGPRNNRQPLPQGQFFDITMQICDGLAYAHSKGIIHRDIKLRNILLRERDGVVKIIDWGVAKNIDIAGRGRTYAGTPPYMSPEVVLLNRGNVQERMSGQGVDHRTDIYSLGVTMYEMVTTGLPFVNPITREDDILSGVNEEHRRGMLQMGLDPNVVAIIMKAMARDPEKRYQTALELKAALLEFRESGRTIMALPGNFKPVERPAAAISTEYFRSPSGASLPSAPPSVPSSGTGNSTSQRSITATLSTLSKTRGGGIAIGVGLCTTIAVGAYLFMNRGTSFASTAPTPAPSVAKLSAITPMPIPVRPTPAVVAKPKTIAVKAPVHDSKVLELERKIKELEHKVQRPEPKNVEPERPVRVAIRRPAPAPVKAKPTPAPVTIAAKATPRPVTPPAPKPAPHTEDNYSKKASELLNGN